MNKTYTPFILIIVALLVSDCLIAQSPQEAINHMTQLQAPTSSIRAQTWDYMRAVTRGKRARKIEKERKKLITEIRDAKNEISRMRRFHGDDTLKQAYVNYLGLYYKVISEDYADIVDMEEIAEQSYDYMEAYLLAQEQASEKLNDAFDELRVAETVYAEKYNFNLIEGEGDKLSQKIEKSGAAIAYYNDIFLVQFKCGVQETKLFSAIEKEDVNAMKQSISAMISYANEGVKVLDTMPDFKGDGSLKVGVKHFLAYYHQAASNDYPKMIEFLLEKERVEKAKKVYEAKGYRATQADMDQYQMAIDSYNSSMGKYNGAIQRTNKAREKCYDSWNDRIEEFYQRHTN